MVSAAPELIPDESDRLLWALAPVLASDPPSWKSEGALEVLAIGEAAVRDDPLRLWIESHGRRDSLVTLRALRLGKELETCEAILRGELVAGSRLDPDWRKAYGL